MRVEGDLNPIQNTKRQDSLHNGDPVRLPLDLPLKASQQNHVEAGPFWYPGGRAGCLLIHGLTGTAEEMRYLGERLNRDKGFTVSGITLAGHGTDAGRFEQMGWRDWYRSAEQGMAKLSQVCTPIFAVGFSMGGLLAMLLALDHEPDVRAVALLATPLFANCHKARLASILYGLPGMTMWLCKRAQKQTWEGLPRRRDLPPGHANLAQLKWILRRRGACLRQPALILHSRQDPSVPWENALALTRLLASRNKRRVLFSRSRHVLPLDLDRDRVAEEIGTFFLDLSTE